MPSRVPSKSHTKTRATRSTSKAGESSEAPVTRATRSGTKNSAHSGGKKGKQYCLCKGSDVGTPMINCQQCKDWFHFACVELSEDEAEDIEVYVCPSCQTKTGLRSVKHWEGPEALEEADDDKAAVSAHDEQGQADVDAHSEGRAPPEISESENDASEDEYVEGDKTRVPEPNAKRRVRRVSVITSDSDGDEETKKARRAERRPSVAARSSRKSSSPPASPAMKRKHSDALPPVTKRTKRADSVATPAEDATRKYCLGKYVEMFSKIFLRYPHVHAGDEQHTLQEKVADELTEEQRAEVEASAKAFAEGLEESVYELYAEQDEHGKPRAAGKYKERFRMLSFNLSKPDRVVLHRSIASSEISAKELSLMSSTDLANEETKASIKIAEEESLAQTILKKSEAPRAKITHKGLQDIEDVHGGGEKRREQDQEEEERREKERLARVRPVLPQVGRSMSGSQPPDSPIVPQTPSWGGPPPLPHHLRQDSSPMLSSPLMMGRPPLNPLFVPSASDMSTLMEPELNLADLINIDEDPVPLVESPDHPPLTPTTPPGGGEGGGGPSDHVQATADFPTSSAQREGESAPSVDTPDRSASFDLGSLWSAPSAGNSLEAGPSASLLDAGYSLRGSPKDTFAELDALVGDTEDQDFDMFLENDDEQGAVAETATSVPSELPTVWTGTLSMPLDSSVPQETPVLARQMAGRHLEADSLLWKTLFPSQQLRIDGRVAIDKSAQYLMQMRMNSAKELIAVAFYPESHEPQFQGLVEHLINKKRHGLVFPWGNRPKDHHPGRELYIIPLLSNEPIPEYMELMDDLHLPKSRESNCLVGIWILNKGKLAPPPTPLAPVASQQPVASTSTVSSSPAVPYGASAGVPPSASPTQSLLAQQVASLTPEQIQAMLRSLTGSALPVPNASPPPPPSPSHFPPAMPMPPFPPTQAPVQIPLAPGPPHQPWAGAMPPFPPQYPPQNASSPPPPSPYPPPAPSYNQPPFDRGPEREYYRDGPQYDRGGPGGGPGGWQGEGRGRGRERGRGRGGRGRGRGDGYRRDSMDSGWERSRGRGY